MINAPPGVVLTFYSYKGGVGRSMALANVAALLSKLGKKVLVIDWDLEAPGIERYFGRDRADVPGLVDLVNAREQQRALDWRACLTTVLPFSSAPPISILGAGRPDEGYVNRVLAINWMRLFEEHDFGRYLEELREQWIAEFDFVLIDSRTGITDIGGICTIQLPDIVVALFTANDQSLLGVKSVLRTVRAAHAALPVDRASLMVVPIAARDESANVAKLAEKWHVRFGQELAEHYAAWLPRDVDPVDAVTLLKVPYVPDWSFGEPLPVTEERGNNPGSLSAAYGRLARLIVSRLDWNEVTDAKASTAAADRRARDAEELAKRAGRRTKLFTWSVAAGIALGAAFLSYRNWMAQSARRDAIVASAKEAKDPLESALLLNELAPKPTTQANVSPMLSSLVFSDAPPAGAQRAAERLFREPLPIQVLRGVRSDITTVDACGTRSLAIGTADGTLIEWPLGGAGEPRFDKLPNHVRAVRCVPRSDQILATTPDGVWLGRGSDWRQLSTDFLGPFVETDGERALWIGAQAEVVAWSFKESRGHNLFEDQGAGLALFGGVDRIVTVHNGREQDLVVWNGAQVDPYASWRRAGADCVLNENASRAVCDARSQGIVTRTLEAPHVAAATPNVVKAEITTLCMHGDRIGVGWSSGVVGFWRAGGPLHTISFHTGAILGCSFSGDGAKILFASSDHAASVWKWGDVASGLVLRGHTAAVDGGEFIDDRRVYTSSADRTVRVWQLPAGDAEGKSWDELSNRLREQVNACLTPGQRVRLLLETSEKARGEYEACERSHSRTPLPTDVVDATGPSKATRD